MTALAIGAAMVPPWYWLAGGWSSTSTATAIWGSGTGAKATNQVSMSGPPVCAVPVLPATWMPGMRAATPVPSGLSTTESISLVIWAAVAGVVALSHTLGR